MAALESLKMTAKGREIQSKALTNKRLLFTRVEIGSGRLGNNDPDTLTALVSYQQDATIQDLMVIGDGTSRIRVVFDNQDVTSDYQMREAGLYAEDPDDGREYLYAYTNSGDRTDYMPAYGGPNYVEFQINFITRVGDAPDVRAVIDESIIYATRQDLQDHIEASVAHTDAQIKLIAPLSRFPNAEQVHQVLEGLQDGSIMVKATKAQALSGTDHATIMTPLRVAEAITDRTATIAKRGIVELATVTEARAGTDTERAVTPQGLDAALDVMRAMGSLSSGQGLISFPYYDGAALKKLIVQFFQVTLDGPGNNVGDAVAHSIPYPSSFPTRTIKFFPIGLDNSSFVEGAEVSVGLRSYTRSSARVQLSRVAGTNTGGDETLILDCMAIGE